MTYITKNGKKFQSSTHLITVDNNGRPIIENTNKTKIYFTDWEHLDFLLEYGMLKGRFELINKKGEINE